MRKADNIKESARNQRIQVFARCRPINNNERKQGSPCVVEVHPERKEVRVKDDKMINRSFAFDKVFGPDTKQISVYKAVVEPLIREVLMGYNCTVFAYGQTGTGKTFTMEGERSGDDFSWDEDPNAGIIPRSLHQLFEELTKEENVEFSVHVSFLELYNEDLYDLLSRNDSLKLRLFEDSARKGSVVIQNLEEIKVNTKDEVYAILKQGTFRRRKAETNFNEHSSRSHAVFSVTVHIKENTVDGEELLKTGKLNLVDLAGSENIGRSGATLQKAREAGNINQSLLTLGRVITALVEKAPHIPYRESKLTRLLQDSLGGHTKTSIIATISPALCNIDETLSTLDYAQRAKNITIKPEINQKMTKKYLIKQYTEEIERLRKDLVAARGGQNGFFVDSENYSNMQLELTSKIEKVVELEDKIEAITVKMQQVEELFTETQAKLHLTTNQLNITSRKYENKVQELSDTQKQLTSTKTKLAETIIERDEKEYVIGVQNETGKQLFEQTKTLKTVTEESTTDVSALHCKIDRKQKVESTNEVRSQEFQVQLQERLAKLDEVVSSLGSDIVKDFIHVQQDVGNLHNMCNVHVESVHSAWSNLFKVQQQHATLTFDFLKQHFDAQSKFCHEMENAEKQKMEEFMESQKCFYNSVVTPLLNSTALQHKQLVSHLESKQRELFSRIEESKGLIANTASTLKESVSGLRQSCQDYFKSHSALMRENNEHRASMVQKENIFHQKILEMLKNAATYVESGAQDFHKSVSVLDSDSTRLGEINDSAAAMTDSLLNQVEESIEPLQLQVFGRFDEHKLLHACSVTEELEMLQSVSSSTKELGEKLAEHSDECKVNCEAHLASVTKTCDDKEKQVWNAWTQHEEISQKQKHELQDVLTGTKIQLEEITGKMKLVLDGVNLVATDGSQKMSSTVEAIQTDLQNSSLEVQTFVSEGLAKDVPTGTTPQRKEYVYPRSLIHFVSPKTICEEYRAQMRNEDNEAIHEVLNSSFNESPDSKTTVKHSSEELKEDAIEGSTGGESCSESDSSVSSFSDARNKENIPAGHGLSSIPIPKRIQLKKKKVVKKKKLDLQALAPPSSKLPLHQTNENIVEG